VLGSDSPHACTVQVILATSNVTAATMRHSDSIMSVMRGVAHSLAAAGDDDALAGRFYFARIDAVRWESFLEQFVSSEQVPGFFVHDALGSVFYHDPTVTGTNRAAVLAFLTDVVRGKVPSKVQGGAWFAWLQVQLQEPVVVVGVGFVFILSVLLLFALRHKGPRTHIE
jgi:hypothetical protein